MHRGFMITWELVKKPRTPAANGTSRLDVASPGVNFLMKSDTVVLIMTGSPTRAIHGADRLTRTSCPLSPCLLTLFKKISTPSDRHRGMTFRPPWAFCVLKIPWKNTESISCYWFLYSSKVIYILNSCFQILYMCFLKRFTYLFSILAYCACVFPFIIHAGSLFLALKHVFSDLLYIPNYDFWIIRMYFLLFCTY